MTHHSHHLYGVIDNKKADSFDSANIESASFWAQFSDPPTAAHRQTTQLIDLARDLDEEVRSIGIIDAELR